MKVEKNKIYESLKADAELKDKILKESIKTIKTVSLPGDDELSLRRNEKMKKKEKETFILLLIIFHLIMLLH